MSRAPDSLTMRPPLVTTVTLVSSLLSLVTTQTIPQQMTIAAVFDEGGDRKHELAFRHAVRSINRNPINSSPLATRRIVDRSVSPGSSDVSRL